MCVWSPFSLWGPIDPRTSVRPSSFAFASRESKVEAVYRSIALPGAISYSRKDSLNLNERQWVTKIEREREKERERGGRDGREKRFSLTSRMEYSMRAIDPIVGLIGSIPSLAIYTSILDLSLVPLNLVLSISNEFHFNSLFAIETRSLAFQCPWNPLKISALCLFYPITLLYLFIYSEYFTIFRTFFLLIFKKYNWIYLSIDTIIVYNYKW